MILDFKSLKQGVWVSLAAVVFAMILGLSSIPFFWQAYTFIFIVKLGWCVYLMCACEKFTSYVGWLFIAMLGFLTLMAGSMAYFLTVRSLRLGGIQAIIVGLLPAVCSLLVYFFIVNTKALFDPFEYDGIKVQPRPQAAKKDPATYPLVLLAGTTTLAAGIFTKSVGIPVGGVIGAVLLTFCSIFVLINLRHSIRGLRTLRIQQKTMPIPYTFMQIDEIREARSRWWLSRLFKWVASWRKSPGA